MAESKESQRTMTEKILVVNSPDDVFDDGFRILAVDLDRNQSELISSNLLEIAKNKIILYTWMHLESTAWLLDKKNKSDIIIFNAESVNQYIVGYMSAQPDAYYFGTLRDLNIVNNNILLNKDSSLDMINHYLGNYERKFK